MALPGKNWEPKKWQTMSPPLLAPAKRPGLVALPEFALADGQMAEPEAAWHLDIGAERHKATGHMDTSDIAD
jgi:hypothetical protein